jgi:hypothetical protein
MSWDVVIFSTEQRLASVEEVDKTLFRPRNFNEVLQRHLPTTLYEDGHLEIKGNDFTIVNYGGEELSSVALFNLYGELALYALIHVAKLEDWQIFDTGIGAMIDLDHPEKNGYWEFQAYLQHVLNNSP